MRPLEGPLSPTERIFTLDVVRGFALLGILIMNMPGFANSFFIEADGSPATPRPAPAPFRRPPSTGSSPTARPRR